MKKYLIHPFTISIGISIFILLLILISNIPLGIPRDWIWIRIKNPHIPYFELLTVFIIFSLGVFIACYIDFKVPIHKKKLTLLGISLVCILGVFFDYHVLLCGRISISENVLAVGDKWTTGYLTQAAQVDNINRFLAEYNRVIEKDEEKSNHTDVHPPGNTLFSLLCITLAKTKIFKTITEELFSNWDIENTKKLINDANCYSNIRNIDFNLFVYSAFCIVFFFLLLLGTAKFILIISLLNFSKEYHGIGLSSLFLWSIPAPVLFLGAYDTLYYFFSSVICLLLSLWFNDNRNIILFIVGVFLGIYMGFSIGFSCVIFLLITILLLHNKFNYRRFLTQTFFILLGGFSTIILYYIFRIHIIEICFLCIRNNHRFFTEANRSSLWICMNYLDYFLFVGSFPIVMLCFYCRKKRHSSSKDSFIQTISYSYVITLILLFLSSFSRGEMGRLSLLLIPFNVIISCFGLQNICNIKSNYYAFAIVLIFVSISQLLTLRIFIKTVVMF